MKINFGKYKNQTIIVPNNIKMRPTTSRAKSIIFDTLGNLQNQIILDLFAGTGLLGFESLSLGAGKVTFSDNNIESIKSIKQTLKKLNVSENSYQIFKSDFRRILKFSNQDKFDVIFLDPPFSVEKYFEEALFLIKHKDLLKKSGLIVMEIPFQLKIDAINEFEIVKKSKLGDKDIYFLKSRSDS